MKIRKGFVSNSSSANFIVDSTFKTVFDLAKEMLRIRDLDRTDMTDAEKRKHLTETASINRAIRDGRDPDTPVYFTTCNYDTYIKKVEGYYVVTTCNNHPFVNNLRGIVLCPSEVKDWLRNSGYIYSDYDDTYPFDEAIESWDFQANEVFWSPKYDLEVSRYDYMEDRRKGNEDAKGFCTSKEHFSDMMVLNSTGEIICPICYLAEQESKQPKIEDRFEILDIRDKDED